MKEVFISYTSADQKVANQIVTYLESRGVSCFIAPRDVDPGKPYASNLMKAITECSAIVLVASDAINTSSHVLNEVDVMVEKKKVILPVFIEDFELNDDYRYYIGRTQWVVAYPESLETYLASIYDGIESYLPKHSEAITQPTQVDVDTLQKTKTVFEYNPERGIMINPEDHQRNVSFRTDTFINMMGGIYEKVSAIADENAAAEIFFESGYVSGKSFADRINSQWDTGYTIEELKHKIDKWCMFDSAVGWGNFSASIDYDEEHGLVGELRISKAFVVDKSKKRKVCNFIKGYCTGVIETLLGGVDIELTCRECPLKNKFKCVCVFDIRERPEQ